MKKLVPSPGLDLFRPLARPGRGFWVVAGIEQAI